MADNAQPVSKDGELVGIAEMPVDVLLFGIGAGSSPGWHEAIGHLIWIDIRFVFVIGFQLPDKGIQSFRVVFGDIKFNAGGVESKHLCKRRINGLADRFREINHLLEHELNIRKKLLFKVGKEWGIRDFGEAAEIPQFLTKVKKKDKERVGGDGKDLL